MGFLLKKTLSFDHYDGWKGCYVMFRAASKDTLIQLNAIRQEASEDYDPKSIELLDNIIMEHFISGKAIDGESAVVELTKETVVQLPIEMYQEIVAFLVRPTASPKSGSTNVKGL